MPDSVSNVQGAFPQGKLVSEFALAGSFLVDEAVVSGGTESVSFVSALCASVVGGVVSFSAIFCASLIDDLVSCSLALFVLSIASAVIAVASGSIVTACAILVNGVPIDKSVRENKVNNL